MTWHDLGLNIKIKKLCCRVDFFYYEILIFFIIKQLIVFVFLFIIRKLYLRKKYYTINITK